MGGADQQHRQQRHRRGDRGCDLLLSQGKRNTFARLLFVCLFVCLCPVRKGGGGCCCFCFFLFRFCFCFAFESTFATTKKDGGAGAGGKLGGPKENQQGGAEWSGPPNREWGVRVGGGVSGRVTHTRTYVYIYIKLSSIYICVTYIYTHKSFSIQRT